MSFLKWQTARRKSPRSKEFAAMMQCFSAFARLTLYPQAKSDSLDALLPRMNCSQDARKYENKAFEACRLDVDGLYTIHISNIFHIYGFNDR